MDTHKIPTAAEGLPLEPGERLLRGFQRFGRLAAAGGITLIVMTVIALVWANSAWYDAYAYIFKDMGVHLEIGNWHLPHIHNLAYFINDALMAIFFLYVGLEIKRELLVGELRSVKRATLPIAAAIGGMVIPALIYFGINSAMTVTGPDGEVVNTMKGWGVPMATDIAFALGILTLLGSRAPLSLKVFLTSLAIVDDLGALLVIAIFYTEELKTNFLFLSAGTVGFLFVLNALRFRHPLFYIVPGIALWVFVLSSGIHATIAGVLLAATVPASARVKRERFLKASRKALDHFEKAGDDGSTPRESSEQRAAAFALKTNTNQILPPLHRMEHALGPWCAFWIIPIFALANAGLKMSGDMGSMVSDPVTLGVFFGLSIGKPIGVVLFCWLACKIGIAALPPMTTWRHIIGAGCLAGIGFTMALFIANLAFKGDALHLDAAKLGILSASLVATIAGLSILMTCKPMTEAEAQQDEGHPPMDNHSDSFPSPTPPAEDTQPQAKAS
ncbi:MAG: Na+/H+ antiporter NhaA [Phycisphaera sp.]|nr:MAG: Na+/H+ antiporter NhaA [Phycisphaera sp.]